MATYIAGIDRTSVIDKTTPTINYAINSEIDTMSLSIQGNSITIVGGEEIVMTDDVNAIQQSGISLDGGPNSYLIAPAATWFPTGAVTVECWVYLRSYGEDYRLFDFKSADGLNSVSFGLSDALGRLFLQVKNNGGSANTMLTAANYAVPLNTLTHVALTVSATNNGSGFYLVRIYINGVLSPTNITDYIYGGLPPIGTPYTENKIGGSNTVGAAPTNVVLSHFRLWSTERSAQQILASMNYEVQPPTAGLNAYWRFCDSGIEAKAYDLAQNDRTLTMPSGASYVTSTLAPLLLGTRIFAGYIVSPAEQGDKKFIGYQIDCRDYTARLNRMLVVESFITISPGAGDVPIHGTYYPASDIRTWTLGKIVRYIIPRYAVGFTTSFIPADSPGPIVDSASFNYVYMSDCLDKLRDMTSYEWYVDAYRNVRFFKSEDTPAPEALNDTSRNFRDLKVSVDRSQLKNRVYVKGGSTYSEPSTTLPTFSILPVAGNRTYTLPNAPYSVKEGFLVAGARAALPAYDPVKPRLYRFNAEVVSATTGAYLRTLPVGIEGSDVFKSVSGDIRVLARIDDSNPAITWDMSTGTAPLPPVAGERLDLYYEYKLPILTLNEDRDSIEAIAALEGTTGELAGVYEFILEDSSISTFQEARNRAKAELRKYANPIVNGSFSTHIHGFQVGQLLTINVPRDKTVGNANIVGQYKIRSVTRQSDGVGWSYNVSFTKQLYDASKDTLVALLADLAASRVQVGPNEILNAIYSARDNVVPAEVVEYTDTNANVYQNLAVPTKNTNNIGSAWPTNFVSIANINASLPFNQDVKVQLVSVSPLQYRFYWGTVPSGLYNGWPSGQTINISGSGGTGQLRFIADQAPPSFGGGGVGAIVVDSVNVATPYPNNVLITAKYANSTPTILATSYVSNLVSANDLQTLFNEAIVKTGLQVTSGNIEMQNDTGIGTLETKWFDKGATGRALLNLGVAMTLPHSTAIRYYIRTSVNSSGSSPSRWKTLAEARISLDRYWQLQVNFSG